MENCELVKVDKLQLRIFVQILVLEKKSDYIIMNFN